MFCPGCPASRITRAETDGPLSKPASAPIPVTNARMRTRRGRVRKPLSGPAGASFLIRKTGVTLLFKQDKHREIGLKITKRVVEKLQEKRKEEKLEEDR